jgi:ABC-type nitrate/sulfonate/bicarbonate transport system permease component
MRTFQRSDTPDPVSSARRKTSSLAARLIPPLVVVLAVLVLWQLYVQVSHADPTTLPGPWRVLDQGWAHRSELWTNTLPTLQEVMVGFALALVLSWVIASVMDFSPLVRRGVYPLLIASQTVPIITIAPLFLIWFGIGLLPRVLLVALATFFPLTVNLAEGFASTDNDAMRLLRSMGASRFRSFLKVRVPTAMPFFFAGLRISITYAVLAAVFAEDAGAFGGLAVYMQQSSSSYRVDLVLATVGVIAVLSLGLFGLTYVLQRLVLPWQRVDARAREWE